MIKRRYVIDFILKIYGLFISCLFWKLTEWALADLHENERLIHEQLFTVENVCCCPRTRLAFRTITVTKQYVSLNLVRVSYENILVCNDDMGRSAHIRIAPVHMAKARLDDRNGLPFSDTNSYLRVRISGWMCWYLNKSLFPSCLWNNLEFIPTTK